MSENTKYPSYVSGKKIYKNIPYWIKVNLFKKQGELSGNDFHEIFLTAELGKDILAQKAKRVHFINHSTTRTLEVSISDLEKQFFKYIDIVQGETDESKILERLGFSRQPLFFGETIK